jgi:hypothetical protein
MARSCWSSRGPRAGQRSGMERQGTCEIPSRSSGRVPDRAARLIKAQARTRTLPRRERCGEHEHREAWGAWNRTHKGPGHACEGSRSAFIVPAKSGNRARWDPTEEREASRGENR